MMGSTEKQITFSDCWLEGKIPDNSYWSKMRKWALENLDEKMFQPLFSYYGRPSVSPIYTFTGILVQLEKGYSDREFEGESRFDDRVKYAITAPRDFDGIDANTLSDHRKRYFTSEIGRKIFVQTIEKAREEGMFSEKNLNVIDSFMVWGAASKQDTYTLIYQGIKMVLRVAGFYEMEKEARDILKRSDYSGEDKKPKIDWNNEEEKQKLLESLVNDALSLVGHFEGKKELPDDLREACHLLERIAKQDVKIDKDGKVSMINGTAKDRIISVNDPEMRHGHKTSSRNSDGYKAEIITGGELASIIVAVEVDGANTEDGRYMGTLIDEATNDGVDIKKIYGDSSYSDFEEIEKRKNEVEFCVKVRSSHNGAGGYTKEKFEIDLKNGTVTCPEGNVKKFEAEKVLQQRKQTMVHFSEKTCRDCPQREKCTQCKDGRRILIHPYEDKLHEQRMYQKTEEFKEDYNKRANVERTISHVTAHGGRKSRYKGKKKTKWQLIMASINHNIKMVMGYIKNKPKQDTTMGELCPQMS